MAEQSNRDKGTIGEDFATEYLEKLGYKILKRNFNFGKLGEIDIIAEIKNVLVFVEVRSQFFYDTPDPINSIGYGKRTKLRKAAEGYVYVNKIENKEMRFDVIILDFSQKPTKVTHLENAM